MALATETLLRRYLVRQNVYGTSYNIKTEDHGQATLVTLWPPAPEELSTGFVPDEPLEYLGHGHQLRCRQVEPGVFVIEARRIWCEMLELGEMYASGEVTFECDDMHATGCGWTQIVRRQGPTIIRLP